MSERETVVELPWAADGFPCVEKLRTVLPLTGGIRDGAERWVRGCTAQVASMDKKREQTLLGGRGVPGAGTYNEMRSSHKPDMNSAKPTAPRVLFGTGERLAMNRSTAHLGPGPGTYVV
jgi:hypothetical protein